MEEESVALSALVEEFGESFLAYVLDLPPDAVEAELADLSALTSGRSQVLSILAGFLRSLPSADEGYGGRFNRQLHLGALAEYLPAEGSGLATYLRRHAGGKVRAPYRKDPVAKSLLRLAVEIYPLFLLPTYPDEPLLGELPAGLTRATNVHPESQVFRSAVLKDPKLAALFPAEDERTEYTGMRYESIGRAQTFQLVMFADGLFGGGWELARRQSKSPSIDEFCTATLDALAAIKSCAAGKTIMIPALIGVAGVLLPDDTVLDVPGGVLRNVTDADLRHVPPGLSGRLNHTSESGEKLQLDYAGDLVLDVEVPYSSTLSDDEPTDDQWPGGMATVDVTESLTEAVRVGLLLSVDRQARPFAVATWRHYCVPYHISSGGSWVDPRNQGRSLSPALLTAAEANDWGHWTRLIADRRTQAVDVALRRTVMSAAERRDPSDGLIDAVIAWENLVGSRRGEPTLRISTALAWLLGNSVDERAGLQKQLKKLYDVRSKVVHGTTFLSSREASESHREALDVTIRALRVLFGDRPELLKECKDGDQRSNRLIVGG